MPHFELPKTILEDQKQLKIWIDESVAASLRGQKKNYLHPTQTVKIYQVLLRQTHVSKYYQLKVSLMGMQPEIFRTFTLPCNATFFDLHTAIQFACGWGNYHSYMFQNADEEDLAKPYSSELIESDDNDDDTVPDDITLKLSSYFQDESKVEKCFYLYDFQDYWLHSITLQQIVEDDAVFSRKLLDGARAFPPESCGGIRGYEELCALKETGRIPDSLDWGDAANIMELLDEWSPDDFNFNRLKAIFDLPAQFQKKSA